MDRERLFELQHANLDAFIRTMTHAAGGHVEELDGVTAAVMPMAPTRSIANSVIWRDPESLDAALTELAATYERAGVRAWTVWVPEHERDAASILERSGHSLDAEPAAMFAGLAELPEIDLVDLDWDAEAEASEVGRVNDLAYGYPEAEGIAAGAGHGPPDLPTRLYRARVDGEVVSVMETIDAGSDCVVVMVATLPEHRGKCLAGRLLRAALGDARERGLHTSTLQASMLGKGVYERVGYRVGGRLQMYERRV